MKDFDVIIGLEVHAEICTNSKIFCSCRNAFGYEPNSHTCPVCLGLPGALPVLNRTAVEKTILAGLALGCNINKVAVFERKNYFYPDLPKGYQISELGSPICMGGSLKLNSGKEIRFNRIHLEEDAAKLVHKENETLVDCNRSGVPLIEMVTEPDFRSAKEVIEFLNSLKNILQYLNVSNCEMENGGFRFDINISVREKGKRNLSSRIEMKNLNSFKSVEKAIEYEKARQIEIVSSSNVVIQETRAWDDVRGESFAMREKEDVNDYRYFPDPDLLAINITSSDITRIKKDLVELPADRRQRYISYGISENEADILVSEKIISDFFDSVYAMTKSAVITSHWIITEVLNKYNDDESIVFENIITEKNLAYIVNMLVDKKITRTNAKVLFENIVFKDVDAMQVAKDLNLLGLESIDDIDIYIDEILEDNSHAIVDYRDEPESIINFVLGKLMYKFGGKLDAKETRLIIKNRLNELIGKKR